MQKIIEKITYYDCGYCVNNLKMVFKKQRSEKKVFPAGVFLLHHRKYGYILFDTGYSTKIYNLGWKGRLYNLCNPTFVKEEDQINIQLEKDGIACEDIKYIILSHLHPDHIGCVKYFKNAKIIISENTFRSYKKNRLRDLIFYPLLPEWFDTKLRILSNKKLRTEQNKYFSYYDLFKDHSLLLTQVEGHANGQLCCLINEKIFLGADSSWGNDFVGKSNRFRFMPRMVQSDMKDYIKNDRLLMKMKKDGIQLYFSHDTYEEKVVEE